MIKSFVRKLVPERVIAGYHYVLARVAAAAYKYPSEGMVVVGITGTNGKSTTVQFLGRMLEQMGETVGWTSTASLKVGKKEWVNDQKMTMLGRFQTHKLLHEMKKSQCGYAIVETSSQGLVQHRHVGVHYDVAVFTNLTPEHIEAHGGFEAYKSAKELLFRSLDGQSRKILGDREIETMSVVNIDDDHAFSFLAHEADVKVGFGIRDHGEDRISLELTRSPVIPEQVEFSGACTTFVLSGHTFHFKPVGRFNLLNVLAAIAVLRGLGKGWEEIRDAVESLEAVPGRLERIDEGQPYTVIVDYAYEPAALTAVYEAIELIPHERIIHVTGSAGGGRDEARREILGRMAAERDDVAIVTNEDPYDEDPMQIIHDVADAAVQAGAQEDVNMFRILDRQEAIDFAMKIAKPDDLVLITGKGSEPVMAVANGKKVPWDDREAARKAIQSRS